jgi:hypothetical protein
MKKPFVINETKLDGVPDDVRQACMTLIAWAINSDSIVSNIQLRDLVHEGLPLGDYEVSVKKLLD